MSEFIAALPMYDWPEVRAETDAQWARRREVLLAAGLDAPQQLARRNADMPPVPGGIRDAGGNVIAPDPATLPPDGFDLATLWRHPALLFSQTCWGPMEMGLAPHVRVIEQPDYTAFVGGRGEFYSSAILMRADGRPDVMPSEDGAPRLPLGLLSGKRLAFNNGDSMSGIIGLARDLEAAGESLDLFGERLETGGHRLSIAALAEGRADVCAIDCRSLELARRFEPAVAGLRVVGWTALRKGLPFIASRNAPGRLL